MRLKIDRKIFSDAVCELAPYVPSKTPTDILRNIRITTKGMRMKLEVSDGKIGIIKYVDLIENDSDGSFCINAGDISRFVATLKCADVEIEMKGEESVSIIHSRGHIDCPAFPGKLYPSVKINDEDAIRNEIPSDAMIHVVSHTRSFLSKKPTHPQLCAAYVRVHDGGHMDYCGTDTRKMVVGTEDLPGGDEVSFYVIPDIFQILNKLCVKHPYCTVSVTDKAAIFRIGDTIIHTTQPKEKYPDFLRVVPRDHNIECAIPRAELLETLGRIALVADETGNVSFDFGRLDVSIGTENLLSAKQISETVVHHGCDGEMKINTEIYGMIAALGVFPGSDEVRIELIAPDKQIVVKSDDMKDVTVITMPMSSN